MGGRATGGWATVCTHAGLATFPRAPLIAASVMDSAMAGRLFYRSSTSPVGSSGTPQGYFGPENDERKGVDPPPFTESNNIGWLPHPVWLTENRTVSERSRR